MNVRTMLGLAALAAANVATAASLPFTSAQQTNNAVATNGAVADFQTGSGPQGGDPLITSAVVVGDTDFASAGVINASGLLNTSAEASSTSGFASSDASAEFVGAFASVPAVHFEIQFDVLSNLVSGTGAYAGTNLFVTVANGGTTLYSNAFTSPGFITFNVDLPAGSQPQLSVLLESSANVLTGGSAFNEANVSFVVSAVPEPASALLLTLGAIAVFGMAARRTRGAGTP